MNTYISILRGINVGGNRSIKMDALRRLYEDLGFINVRTFIQSGNVIFQYDQAESRDLENDISDKIKTVFSFDVPVVVKTKKDLAAIFRNNPFIHTHAKETDKLHITLFSDQPKLSDIGNINVSIGNDEFVFWDSNMYLFCPDGYGKTRLPNQFLEQKLKVTATTRNWKTFTELIKISNEACYDESK
jgi:uncharacterized protein (DUF1697 family)